MNNQRPIEHDRAVAPGASEVIKGKIASLRLFAFARETLHDPEINLFRAMQMPVLRIEWHFQIGNESRLAIHLKRKHRTIYADVPDATRVVIRGAKRVCRQRNDSFTLSFVASKLRRFADQCGGGRHRGSVLKSAGELSQ